MPTDLISCDIEALQTDSREEYANACKVFKYLDDAFASASHLRHNPSNNPALAFVDNYFREQLHAPINIYAATAWIQSKGLDISFICSDLSLLEAINANNIRLADSATNKRGYYKTEDRKKNHLKRIEELLQRPLTDVFNSWTRESECDPLQLAVGTLASVECAIALAPHLTLDQISIGLNEAVNGPGIASDQQGKRPSQAHIKTYCQELKAAAKFSSSGANTRVVNTRLQRILGPKRPLTPVPSSLANKRQCTSATSPENTDPSTSTHTTERTDDSLAIELGRHRVRPLDDFLNDPSLSAGFGDDDDGSLGTSDFCGSEGDLGACGDNSQGLGSSSEAGDDPRSPHLNKDLGDHGPPTERPLYYPEKTSVIFPPYFATICEKRRIGSDDLLTPPSSRHTSTAPPFPFPNSEATSTCCPTTATTCPMTMTDLPGVLTNDVEREIRKSLANSEDEIRKLELDLRSVWKTYLLRESEHQTAITRLGVLDPTPRPHLSDPPSLDDVTKRKASARQQHERVAGLIREMEGKEAEKEQVLEGYERLKARVDKEVDIVRGMKDLLGKIEELKGLRDGDGRG